MRIALDARALTGPYTGDRTYWRNLIRSLAEIDENREHDFLLYSRAPIPEEDIPCSPNFTIKLVPARNDRIWTLITLSSALRRDQADLVHVQYTAPPRALCPCPIVTTVHDISFRLYPQWFPPRDRYLMNLTVPISMRSARYVITDSESSRRDILRIYNLPAKKLFSIPLGLSQGFGDPPGRSHRGLHEEARETLKERYDIDSPIILALGVLQPRKNLEMLAAAYGKLKATFRVPHVLVLVGKAGWITAREAIINAAVKTGGESVRDEVLFPGYVPDAELPTWYRACSVFAHPSLYEGFGIPPLEAMACGAPVLVSDAPALPELVGDSAAIAPASDAAAWADLLNRIISDTGFSNSLAEKGPIRATEFSWSRTAKQTMDVYNAAAAPVQIEA